MASASMSLSRGAQEGAPNRLDSKGFAVIARDGHDRALKRWTVMVNHGGVL